MPIKYEEVKYTENIERLLQDVPQEVRRFATSGAAEAAIQKMAQLMAKETSPVRGKGQFKELDRDSVYRKRKRQIAGNERADLYLYGSMVNGLRSDGDSSNMIIRVDAGQDGRGVKKAYNHNTPQSDAAPLVQRQFLPNDSLGERFKEEVYREVEKSIKKYKQPVRRERDLTLKPQDLDSAYDSFFSKLKKGMIEATSATITIKSIEELIDEDDEGDF
jgi:hypothetical protein